MTSLGRSVPWANKEGHKADNEGRGAARAKKAMPSSLAPLQSEFFISSVFVAILMISAIGMG